MIDLMGFYPSPVSLANSYENGLKLPSVLNIIDLREFVILPSRQNPVSIKLKNDIKIRRRKMKKHQKKRLRMRHAVLFRKLQMMREKKEENKLQQLFEFWRIRSEAWDPADKIQSRLHLARRFGYYVDILNTKGSPFSKK
ncbi:hypothetical protein MN116_003590 [Schistosoma mekongi]|uniref:Mitochondrial mRNA-processing protein COX24 C-terminal domain-containing protein n=1 Tax=Schistosoma mekongi TaxID=38744 RepID=A0AAE1ZDK9_SCHME|nr:hypothetical protein MN116_003590 [Schistosoma mekongi]